ncbi:MAG: hypothetical protein AAFN91_11085 [Pseudomonadota bacterium]
MRCSICLAELKETPTGLVCDACDASFEAMVDEDAESLESEQSRFGRSTWIAIASGAVVSALLFFVGIFYFAPGQPAGQGASATPVLVAKLLSAGGFVLSDDGGIVLEALRVGELDGGAVLIADKGCQDLSATPVEAIQWVNISGAPLQSVRPDLPGNWSLDAACPTQDRDAVLGTFLQDGVAISRVDTTGNLIWTQLKTASALNPETVSMRMLDETIYVVSQGAENAEVKIASIDARGEENWAVPVAASGGVTDPKIIQNSFGEILLAWNEGANAVRLVTLSTSGIIVQDTLLPERALALKAVSDDDIARTLILQGGLESVAEVVSASGALEWRWQSADPATPLGVLRDAQGFLVFAASGPRLLVWKLDASGNASEALEVVLAEEISSGNITRLNAVESAATLELSDGGSVDLVLDLRRLSNALTIEPADLPSIALAVADVAVENSDQALADPITLAETPAEEGPSPAPGNVAAAPIEVEPEPTLPEVPLVEASSGPPPQQGEVTGPVELDTAEADTVAVSTAEVTGAIPILVPETDPSTARCTFTCVSLDAAAAQYTLMQSVDVNDGETLADVSLRLNDTHENLCAISGGEPVPEYDRQCGR